MRSKTLDYKEYVVDTAMTLPERTANALDWAAQRHPKQYVAINLLLKAIMGYEHMPRLNNREVEMLRRKMTRVRQILRVKYGRGFVSERGLGVRATVDSADQLKTDVVHAANRFASASRSLANSGSLVNIKDVPATPENKPWIEWWKGSRNSVGLHAQIAAIPGYINMLKGPEEDPPETGEPKEQAKEGKT